MEKLIEQIGRKQQQRGRNEAEDVKLLIEEARLIRRYRDKSSNDWYVKLEPLGLHKRIAARLLELGRNWPTAEQSPGPDLMARLPRDLQKLLPLSRLPLRELPDFLDHHDCRQMERSEVAAAVKEAMGEVTTAEKKPPATRTVLKRVDDFVLRLRGDLAQLPEDARLRMIDEIERSLADLPTRLRSVAQDEFEDDDEDSSDIDADGEAAAGSDEEEGEVATEEPATPAPGTKKKSRT
jgi:hypothetical protein